jgi:hypothetical protein
MKEHEFWRERFTGRVYAIELEDGVVTGWCGPLTRSKIDDERLESFHYSARGADWLERNRQVFELHRTQLTGRAGPHGLADAA